MINDLKVILLRMHAFFTVQRGHKSISKDNRSQLYEDFLDFFFSLGHHLVVEAQKKLISSE